MRTVLHIWVLMIPCDVCEQCFGSDCFEKEGHINLAETVFVDSKHDAYHGLIEVRGV